METQIAIEEPQQIKQPVIKPSVSTDKLDVIKILFLSADPTDATRLRLSKEQREIRDQLSRSKLRERFELHERMAVRPHDFSQALLDIKPSIVHFSGHGYASGEICIEDQSGTTLPISENSLVELFSIFKKSVKCVLLNACYSESQANAIATQIQYVIGMNKDIGDEAAIAFSVGFYQALGAGSSIKEAFNLGRAQIGLHGLSEQDIPTLIVKY